MHLTEAHWEVLEPLFKVTGPARGLLRVTKRGMR